MTDVRRQFPVPVHVKKLCHAPGEHLRGELQVSPPVKPLHSNVLDQQVIGRNLGNLTACEPDGDFFEPIIDETSAFGIRHDRSLSDYEAVATNQAPYNTSAYPDFGTVVNFTYSLNGSQDFEYVASGVLVAPQWVLTAGHNFFVSEEQNAPAPTAGIVVNFGDDPENPDAIRFVSELVFHPTWLNDDDVFGNANDLCLVKLSSSVPNSPLTCILPI